jgi:hypothetical protein
VLADAEVFHPRVEYPAVDPVAVTDQTDEGRIEVNRLHYLLSGPRRVGMRGHIDVQDAWTLEREREEGVGTLNVTVGTVRKSIAIVPVRSKIEHEP